MRRSAEAAKLSYAIDHLAALKLPGHCTAVNAMIRRAILESPRGVSIVISDLENSCASRGLPAGLQPQNQVFIVPVGSHRHSIEEDFDLIQSKFGLLMPKVQVIEPFCLGSVIEFISRPGLHTAAR
jgi:hypothetical protein